MHVPYSTFEHSEVGRQICLLASLDVVLRGLGICVCAERAIRVSVSISSVTSSVVLLACCLYITVPDVTVFTHNMDV